MACNNCDISANEGNHVAMIASTNSGVAAGGTYARNSVIIASDNCAITGTSEMAIIGCNDVTVSANNAAVIGCVGGTYNNSTSYTVRVREIRAYTFSMISDRREKKDIEELEMDPQILDRIQELPLAEFKFKTDSEAHNTRRGFIAQDAQKVFPELVIDKNLNYQKVYRKTQSSEEWFIDSKYTKPLSKTTSNIEIKDDDPKVGTLTIDETPEYLSINTETLSSLIFKGIKVLTKDYRQNYAILKDLIAEENKKGKSFTIPDLPIMLY
jgi:hypothetical protein